MHPCLKLQIDDHRNDTKIWCKIGAFAAAGACAGALLSSTLHPHPGQLLFVQPQPSRMASWSNGARIVTQLGAKTENPSRKPMNAWMLFLDEKRKENSGTEKVDLSSVAAVWKSMSAAEKQPYQAKADAQRTQYDQAIQSGAAVPAAREPRKRQPKPKPTHESSESPVAKRGKAKTDRAEKPPSSRKPLSAYFLFMMELRKNRKITATEAGALWKAASPQERARFEALAAMDKEDYEAQLKEGPTTLKEAEPLEAAAFVDTKAAAEEEEPVAKGRRQRKSKAEAPVVEEKDETPEPAPVSPRRRKSKAEAPVVEQKDETPEPAPGKSRRGKAASQGKGKGKAKHGDDDEDDEDRDQQFRDTFGPSGDVDPYDTYPKERFYTFEARKMAEGTAESTIFRWSWPMVAAGLGVLAAAAANLARGVFANNDASEQPMLQN
eukprot:EG_transcript_8435